MVSRCVTHQIFRKQSVLFWTRSLVFKLKEPDPLCLTAEKKALPKRNTSTAGRQFSKDDVNNFSQKPVSLSPVEGFQGELIELSWENARDILTSAKEFSDDPNSSIQGVQDTIETDESVVRSSNGRESNYKYQSTTISCATGPRISDNKRKLSTFCNETNNESLMLNASAIDYNQWFVEDNQKHSISFNRYRPSPHVPFKATISQGTDSGRTWHDAKNQRHTAFHIPKSPWKHGCYRHANGYPVYFHTKCEKENNLLNQLKLGAQQVGFPRREFFTTGHNLEDSTKNADMPNPTNKHTQLSQKDRLKKAVKEYGATVIVFHIGISLVSLGGFYTLVSSGFDVIGLLMKLGVPEAYFESKVAAGASTFVIAYAVHKVFAPVRIAITLTSVPLIVRYLRRIGFLKNPNL